MNIYKISYRVTFHKDKAEIFYGDLIQPQPQYRKERSFKDFNFVEAVSKSAAKEQWLAEHPDQDDRWFEVLSIGR